MAIVIQTNKKTGITYAYDTTYHWDKEKNNLDQKEYVSEKLILKLEILYQLEHGSKKVSQTLVNL